MRHARPQFVRLDDPAAPAAPAAPLDAAAAIARLQKALQEQREEHEAMSRSSQAAAVLPDFALGVFFFNIWPYQKTLYTKGIFFNIFHFF